MNRCIREPYVQWCERRTPSVVAGGAVYSIELNPFGIALVNSYLLILCVSSVINPYKYVYDLGFIRNLAQYYPYICLPILFSEVFYHFLYLCYLIVIQCIAFQNWRKVHREKKQLFSSESNWDVVQPGIIARHCVPLIFLFIGGSFSFFLSSYSVCLGFSLIFKNLFLPIVR
jgi:hypothetical protein